MQYSTYQRLLYTMGYVACSIILFSHGPMKKMTFGVWVIVLSNKWLCRRCAAHRRFHLTMDMAWEVRNRHHRTARARIRQLLF